MDDQIEAARQRGKTYRTIERQLGVPRATAQRHMTHEPSAIPAKCGRPRKTSASDDEAVTKRAKRKPGASCRDHTAYLRKRRHVTLSRRSVNHRLTDEGLISKRPVKKPLLSPEQKAKRLRFAQKYKRYKDWDHVVFADERPLPEPAPETGSGQKDSK